MAIVLVQVWLLLVHNVEITNPMVVLIGNLKATPTSIATPCQVVSLQLPGQPVSGQIAMCTINDMNFTLKLEYSLVATKMSKKCHHSSIAI